MIQLTPDEMSLLKKFKRCVDQRTLEKMDKKLYHFFMYECTFIAHYSIHGFRDEYSGTDYLRWFEVFAKPNWMFFNRNGKQEELKKACVQYAQFHEQDVTHHFERLERNRKILLLNALQADLYGEQVNEPVQKTVLSIVEKGDGQLAWFG